MIQIIDGEPVQVSGESSDPFILHRLLWQVAGEHNVTPAMLTGPRRCRPLPVIRAEFCRRAYALEQFSLPQIGRVINRDHTSVMYLLGKLNKKPGGEHNWQGFARAAE